ncbi:hypothetical protein HDU67_009308 [Dinochytrium kinnereticum]|nr:hypothetical protein HDU67_009308 [Dinochytrium kinnereticum]
MSERKVLNKYFPPDFDPAKIPRRRMPKDEQHKVRLMTPFSMRCDTCGEYVYKGKKFNARKERVEGETYLGIQIFRFYIRCPKCAAEITFKTDPKNSDYVAELGAQRNFEPWREDDTEQELKADREKEEENNPMKALENRTVDSKREMDILDALDEIRTKNAMNERIGVEDLLGRILDSKQSELLDRVRKQEEEDDAIASAIFKSADGDLVRRIMEDEEEELSGLTRTSLETGFVFAVPAVPEVKVAAGVQPKRKAVMDLGIVRKKPAVEAEKKQAPPKPVSTVPKSVLGGIADYGSDSDD